jgi:ribosome maturation factor RimP
MELQQMVEPVVQAAGMELVEVTFRRERGGKVLRVLIDRDGGVDLQAISTVSERLSRRLDIEGFDPGPYSLEVSSPGVERPLTRPTDFKKRVGAKVKVKATEPIDGSRTFTGTISAADDEHVTITTAAGDIRLRHDQISTARTVFEWGGGAS